MQYCRFYDKNIKMMQENYNEYISNTFSTHKYIILTHSWTFSTVTCSIYRKLNFFNYCRGFIYNKCNSARTQAFLQTH